MLSALEQKSFFGIIVLVTLATSTYTMLTNTSMAYLTSREKHQSLINVPLASKPNKLRLLLVHRPLKTQLNHFFTKDTFWYCFTWVQMYALMRFLPQNAKDVWPKIMECLVPDVQNGEIQAMKI